MPRVSKYSKWWILFAMASAISMIFIDVSALPVALPTIQKNLELSSLGLQWIVNAYTLSLSVLFLAGGRIADRFGDKKTFCLGLGIFSGASALCGLSHSEAWFIFARALQGIGGAFLVPSATIVIFKTFPPHQRGKAMGLYISIGSVFLALGPFIGGLFTEYFSWRLVFWINLPIALLGSILTYLWVPKGKGKYLPFDWPGFITFSIGISLIVIALMQTRKWGWISPWILGSLLCGLILLFLLWKIDRKVEDPYVNFSFFKNKTFSGAIGGIFCTQFLIMVTIFWAIYFQNALGYSPAEAGMLSLLSNFPIMLAAPLGGYILDKKGPRLPAIIGFTLIAFSLFWFLQNLGTKSLWILLSAIIPFGFGVPFIFTPAYTTALSQVPPERRGLASGVVGMLRQLGSTLGLATIGSIFLNAQMHQFAKDLRHNTDTQSMSPNTFEGLLSNAPSALEALQTLPQQSQLYIKQSYLHSFIDAFWWINVLAIFICLLGAAWILYFVKKPPSHTQHSDSSAKK